MESTVQLFSNALNELDSVRKPAEDEIMEMVRDRPAELLGICAQIILSDPPGTERAVLYSLVVFRRIFEITAERPLAESERRWSTLPGELRGRLQTAVFRGLMFPDRGIWSAAVLCVALVIVLERSGSLEMFGALVQITVGKEYPVTAHFAGLAAIKEVYTSGILSQMKLEFLVPILEAHLRSFYGFLGNATSFPVLFVTNVFVTLKCMVEARHIMFEVAEEQERLMDAIESVLTRTTSTEMYNAIMELIYTNVRLFYGKPLLQIDRIMRITAIGIASANVNFSVSSMDFWISIAKKENEFRMESLRAARFECAQHKHMTARDKSTGVKNVRAPTYPWTKHEPANYTVQFAQRHLGPVLDRLIVSNNRKTGVVEDTEDEDPHIVACSLLEWIFVLCPQPVFTAVTKIIGQNTTPATWMIRYGMINGIKALCTCRVQECSQFVSSCGPFLLDSASSEIECVAETALRTISRGIEYYGLLMNTIDSVIGKLLSLVPRNCTIGKCAIDAMTKIACRFDHETPNSPIGHLCQLFGRMQSMVFELTTSWGERGLLNSMEQFVVECVTRLPSSMRDQAKMYVLDVSRQLTDRSNVVHGCEGTVVVEQYLLSVIGRVMKEYRSNMKDVARECVTVLLQVANDRRLLEDVLVALAEVIAVLDNDAENVVEPIFMVCKKGIESRDPRLVTISVVVVSRMFRALPDRMLSLLDTIVILINDCLNSNQFTPPMYPKIARALAEIVMVESEHVKEEIRNCVFTTFRRLLTFPFNVSTDNGIILGNRVYECVLLGYAAVIAASRNDAEFLLRNRRVLFNPIERLEGVFGSRVSDHTLFAVLKFFDSATTYPRKLDYWPLVSWQRNFALVIWAESSDSSDLKKEAERIHFVLSGY